MRSLLSALLAIAIGLGACSLSKADGSDPYTAIPMAALMASPESHDNKPVQTAGFARDTVRGLFLFMSEQDAAHLIYLNAIALDVDRSTSNGRELVARIDDKFVYVTGRFVTLGDWVFGIRVVSTAVVHDKHFR